MDQLLKGKSAPLGASQGYGSSRWSAAPGLIVPRADRGKEGESLHNTFTTFFQTVHMILSCSALYPPVTLSVQVLFL
jgi:hypothetical protein